MSCSDIQYLYDNFLSRIKNCINMCIPVRTVTMGPRDPSYITPLIKYLLGKRTGLRRKGYFEQADIIAGKVNELISQARKHSLKDVDISSTKELWAAV